MQALVLLDLDGCILDSSEPILESLRESLTGVGLQPVTREELHRIVGPPLKESIPLLLAERGASHVDAQEVIDRYWDSHQLIAVELARCYAGMPQVVEQLAERGRVGVVTSKPLPYADAILSALELRDYLDVVEGPSMEADEPKPVTLGRALQNLGRRATMDSIMVGDRHHDIEAGRAHGLATIGVTWGFGSAAELAGAGADRLAHEPASLIPTIDDVLSPRSLSGL